MDNINVNRLAAMPLPEPKKPYRTRVVQAVISSDEDLATIHQAAEKCGVSVSAFVRFYAVEIARQIVSGEMVHAAQQPENQATGA